MSFRLRVTLLTTFAVAFAVVLASAVMYASIRSSLYRPIDEALKRDAAFLKAVSRGSDTIPQPPRRPGGALNFIQVLDKKGKVDPDRVTAMQVIPPGRRGRFGGRPPSGDEDDDRGPGPGGGRAFRALASALQPETLPLRLSDASRDVLDGRREQTLETQTVKGQPLRILNAELRDGGVLQLARSLDETHSSLTRARNLLLAIMAGAILLAGALGFLVMRAASAPLRRLETAMGHVAADADLSVRISETGYDEIGRLASRFNGVLDALSDARAAQQRIVEDASHELRTPLTSIKTNLEVLALAPNVAESHGQLLRDVDAQIDELSELVASLVELAHGNTPAGDREPVDLADLVSECVTRAERASAGKVTFALSTEPSVVVADRLRLQSAVDNLLSNAVKWSGDGTTVAVDVGPGSVSVIDAGPGVPEEDRPYVFDRFYRSVGARGLPGAGLGLAIVKSVAEEHGGSVELQGSERGARFVLTLPFEPSASQPT